MTVEPTPSRPELEPGTVDALREIFAASIEVGRHGANVPSVLASTAREARDKGIEPERLLVAVKDVWYGLPRPSRSTMSDHEHTLLQEVVSRCIQEYYAL